MKREFGRTGDVEAGSIRSCPRNCSGEFFFRLPLGLVKQGLGRRRRVATASQETCLNAVIFQCAGCALGVVFRCGDRTTVQRDGAGRHELLFADNCVAQECRLLCCRSDALLAIATRVGRSATPIEL